MKAFFANRVNIFLLRSTFFYFFIGDSKISQHVCNQEYEKNIFFIIFVNNI